MKNATGAANLAGVEVQRTGSASKRRAPNAVREDRRTRSARNLVAGDGRTRLDRRARWLVAVTGLLLSLTAVSGAQAAPDSHVTSPEPWKAYLVGEVVPATFTCTGVLPGPENCEGDVPNGQPVDTATAGRKSFGVWASDARTRNKTPVYYWVVGITTPTVDQPVDRGTSVPANFDCAADWSTCSATVVAPGGTPVPITNGEPLPSATLGTYELRIRMADTAGDGASTVSRTYRVVDGTAPTVTFTAPTADQAVPLHAPLSLHFTCEDEAGGSGIDPGDPNACRVTLAGPGLLPPLPGGVFPPIPWANGVLLPTAVSGGEYVITVTATDRAGNQTAATRSYRVVEDVTAPTVSILAPDPDQAIPQGGARPVEFSCADDADGLGLDPDEGCVATVTPPGGGPATPIAAGDDVPASTPGVHEIVVAAKDLAGNTATAKRTYRVLAPPTEPEPKPHDPPVKPQDPPAAHRPPAPPATQVAPVTITQRTCPVRAIELLTIQPSGTRNRPTVRLHGWADRSLAGDVVRIRRDGRTVARTTVRRDGSVAVTVTAPRTTKARSRARYRLTVGALRSRALKATRQLVYTKTTRYRDGSVLVTGRSTLRRAPRHYDLVAGSTCGNGPSATTRVRADRNGTFRVVLRPPTSGEGVIYRLRVAGRSATLPVVVLAR